MCAFFPCHKEIIAQNDRRKRESCYKSGISGTNFEPRFQNVKLGNKTGTSVCNQPSVKGLVTGMEFSQHKELISQHGIAGAWTDFRYIGYIGKGKKAQDDADCDMR